VLRRSEQEAAALRRAKARLDRLDFHPRPVRIARVRILHVAWLFRLPWFRRFDGYEMGPLILLRHPLEQTSDDLVVHELCHVWQDQHHRLRLWTSYLRVGYADNPHEAEARRAVDETREIPVPPTPGV
jgi:hypothetical protein